jgi:lipopolysaccharide assembly outer membrane protein LptD (OstA)
MKSSILPWLILSACAVTVIGQESLHLNSGTEKSNLQFTADSIERQDPPQAAPDAYASVVHLKGNVVIRTCCVQTVVGANRPKKLMMIRGDEAVYRQLTDEIEIHGNARVTFQDYP